MVFELFYFLFGFKILFFCFTMLISFQMYTQYVNGYDKAMSVFQDTMKENSEFENLVSQFQVGDIKTYHYFVLHGLSVQTTTCNYMAIGFFAFPQFEGDSVKNIDYYDMALLKGILIDFALWCTAVTVKQVTIDHQQCNNQHAPDN